MTVEEMIGQNIKRARERPEWNWSQERLGQELTLALGVAWSRQAVSKAEQGGRVFAAGELMALAQIFDTGVTDLMQPTGADVELPNGRSLTSDEVIRLFVHPSDIKEASILQHHIRDIQSSLQKATERCEVLEKWIRPYAEKERRQKRRSRKGAKR